MRRSALHSLLLVLLVLTLPLQGLAGVLKLSCAEQHHALETHHAAHGETEHAHRHAGHEAHQDRSASPDGPNLSQAAGSCSACASCHLGMLAVFGADGSIRFSPAGPLYPALASSLSGHIPERLKRPPRLG